MKFRVRLSTPQDVLALLEVNEQNAGACAFYERLGFSVGGRSEDDGQGRPHPLLHLVR